MRTILKFALRFYLKTMARLALFIHRPKIIIVAGSANKIFIKERIALELTLAGKTVKAAERGFNTEIGLPVAILSLPSGYGSYQAWLPIILRAPLAAVKNPLPEFLVLEFGISKPGDMKFLLSIVKPDVAVISDITQRYMDNFSSVEKLLDEYRLLLGSVKKGGKAVLNSDNEKLRNIASEGLRTEMVFFGFGEEADWRIIESENRLEKQTARISARGEKMTLETNRPGKHQLYALLAGKIIGKMYGA
ncbi:MAG: Mur ligase family protein [Patescibacteria group bacterium]|jgi:UDP-N-acetylmuramoyl-tripeptide--D-alanyl-D-alanine ligase